MSLRFISKAHATFSPGTVSHVRLGSKLNPSIRARSRNFHNTKRRSETRGSSSNNNTRANPIAWYAKKLETNPLATKCITSGLIAGSGDLTCQYLVHKRNKEDNDDSSFAPDLIRTGRFAFLGFGLIAPVVHYWYGMLMTRIPGQSIPAVLKRLFCDQILFAPLFIPVFMTSLMTLEGKSWGDEIGNVLKRDVPDVIVSNWVLWVPAMFINFRYVPGQWQVLYSNCIGFVWNTYLSWKTQQAGRSK